MGRWFERLVLAWLLVLGTLWLGYDRIVPLIWPAEPRTVTPRADLDAAEQATIAVFQAVSPSVAFISTETGGARFGAVQQGTGSGFVWDQQGHIVTNNHVIAGAERVGVRLGSDKLFPAEVVGAAPDYDLAVLQITGNPVTLQPIPIGTSEDLQVGQTAFAIGNPFGLDRTLTQGIISATNRDLPTGGLELRGVIQTDAAVNPGNSGGPLLDSAGRLIGVNTAIFSQSGSNAGVGFAIPVDLVNRIVPQLIQNGRVPRHGIGIVALRPDVAARLDVRGVVIAQVVPGSPADEAGLEPIDLRANALGDIITAVNGRPVRSVTDLATELADVPIGEEAVLTVERRGAARTVRVEVSDIAS